MQNKGRGEQEQDIPPDKQLISEEGEGSAGRRGLQEARVATEGEESRGGDWGRGEQGRQLRETRAGAEAAPFVELGAGACFTVTLMGYYFGPVNPCFHREIHLSLGNILVVPMG
jgi:hypothetical protein